MTDEPPAIITGTIWTFMCRCGRKHEYKRRVVSADRYNDVVSLVREVGDEVVLLPVSTINSIAERAERSEQAVRHMAMALAVGAINA